MKNGEILHLTPLKEVFNLRWHIQHLIDESEDENENHLSQQYWMKQTNWKFIKCVIHHKCSMTPEQLKQKPFDKIIKIGHEQIDTEEGESNEEEEEVTTSSDISEQDSESDTTTENEEESNTTEAFQIHNVLNNTMHDEVDSIYDEAESSEEEHVTEIQPYTDNGEQNNKQDNKLLTTNFEVKVENRKVEGLITYSTDQQIFKFKVSSGTNQGVWGIYIDFKSIHSKSTIHAILQHMGFYATTEN